MAKLGATDTEMAQALKVSRSTLSLWKTKNKTFSDTLKAAKEEMDSEVEKSLLQRARGYSHPDVHISNYKGEITETMITKHYPPSEVACIFWLKNRQPDKWRERQAMELTGPGGADLLAPILAAAAEMAKKERV